MPSSHSARSSHFVHAATDPVAQPSVVPPKVDCFGLSDRGLERLKNEDAFVIATLERTLSIRSSNLAPGEPPAPGSAAGGLLFAVADGMGGMGGGDVASHVGITSVVDYMLSRMAWLGRTVESEASPRASLPAIRAELDRAFHVGDAEVKRAGEQSDHPHMGTTLTLAYVLWPRLYVAHAGDTRCSLWRDGTLHRLTHDHNVAEQVRESGLDPVQPDSPLQNVLWNALGVEPEVQPEIQRHTLVPGDTLLLCSDGLTKHVSDEAVTRILAQGRSAAASCQALVDAANARGGSDNITVVVARFSA